MNDRPTPETDAENNKFRMGGFTIDFCRKLERERDEAREQLSAAKHFLEKYIAERDNAIQKAERYRIDANSMMLQRDRAIFALQELWQIADSHLPQIDEEQSEKWHKAMFGDSVK